MTGYSKWHKREKPPSKSIHGRYLEAVGWFKWFNRPNFQQLTAQGNMTCDCCGFTDRHFSIAHIRRYKICYRHARFYLHREPPEGQNWRDIMQLSLAKGVLAEIKKCVT